MAIQREQVVRSAEKLASRGRIDAAIREYRKVLSESPGDVATLNRVGDLYARADRNDEAIKLYSQIAESYTEDGFFVKAIAIYKKIIKLDPTRLEVYENLASLYHRQGLLNEARTQYQVLADYYLKHDNPTSAIAIYERMTEVNPDDPALRAKLADLYREMKLLDKALGEYRSIAETMLAAGAADEAEQVYRRALDVDASDVGFITDAVLKLREAGQVGLAAHLLAQAVELNPQASRVAKLVGLERPPVREGTATDLAGGEDRGTAAAASPGAVEVEEPGEDALPSGGDLPDLEAAEELSFSDLDVEPPLASEPEEAAAVDEASPPEPSAATVPEATPPPPFPEELELDLDEVFALDLDDDEPAPDTQVRPPADLDDSDTPAAAFRDWPAAAGRGPLGVDPDVLERTAAEIVPERIRQEGDLLTEAEVLWKYGLAEKAGERLGELLAINPTNVGALALQVRFHLDQGAHGEAAASASRLRTISDERSEAWLATAERLDAAGYQVTADAVLAPADDSATLPGSPEGLTAEDSTGAEEGVLDLAGEDDFAAFPELDLSAFEEGEEPTAGADASAGAAVDEPETTVPEDSPATPAGAAPEAGKRPARRPRTDIDSLLAEIASGVGTKRRPAATPRRDEPDVASPPPVEPPEAEPAAAQPSAAGGAADRAAELSAESVDWLAEVERATGRIGPEGEVGRDEFFDAEDDFFDLAAELE
ncbi:MAG TPA: tetratricopeptide repeat protein, partial [Thermoanaerobaculia bacterium]|nr:tetratricopeptide repeat protein [Thermoanaerobaculia bacterium]